MKALRGIIRVFAGPALVVALASSPRAEPDESEQRARELNTKAERHFRVGEFDRALKLYREAYMLKPLPGFLFNIGQCHRHLGQFKQAVFQFRQFLNRYPGAEKRDEVEKLLRICEANLAKSKRVSQPPPPHPSSKPAIRTTASPTPDREAPAGAGPVSDEDSGTPDGREGTASRRRGVHPAWFWATAGLASALLVAGTVTGAMALQKSAEYTDGSTSYDRRHDLKDTGETLAKVSTATVITGAAAAVGAGVLFFLRDRGPRGTSAAAAAVPAGGVIVVRGRF